MEPARTRARSSRRGRVDRPARPVSDGPHCSACKAPIRWAVTIHGKLQPLNRDPDPAGNVVLTGELVFVAGKGVHPRSRVLTKKQREPSLLAVEEERYMPHHATCPKVAQFRGRKSA